MRTSQQNPAVKTSSRISLRWMGLALCALLVQCTLTPCLCFAQTQTQSSVRSAHAVPLKPVQPAHCKKCPDAEKVIAPAQPSCHQQKGQPTESGHQHDGRCCAGFDNPSFLSATTTVLPARPGISDATSFVIVAVMPAAHDFDAGALRKNGRAGPDTLSHPSQLRRSSLLGRAPPVSA